MLLYNCLASLLFVCTIKSTNCQGMFNDLIKSTQLLVNYYKEQYGFMNLDGIYGLRVLEGQTLLLLEKIPDLDRSVHSILMNVYQEAHNISEHSLSFLKRDDEEYFAKLHPLVAKPLLIAESYRRVDPKLKWPKRPPGKQKEISEVKSDECITNLLGSGSKPKCYMPEECLDIFTEPGYADYSLTHQILYSLVVQQHGCTAGYETYLENKGYRGGMTQLRLEFCTNVFYDAASVVQSLNKTLLPITQDLFMEQVFTCAVMGFMEFVHVDWLRLLISWQKPSGCFGEMPRQTAVKLQPKDMDYQYADDKPERSRKEFDTGHNVLDVNNNNNNNNHIDSDPNRQNIDDYDRNIQHVANDHIVQRIDNIVHGASKTSPVVDQWQLKWAQQQQHQQQLQQQQQQYLERLRVNPSRDEIPQNDVLHLAHQQMFGVPPPPQQQQQQQLQQQQQQVVQLNQMPGIPQQPQNLQQGQLSRVPPPPPPQQHHHQQQQQQKQQQIQLNQILRIPPQQPQQPQLMSRLPPQQVPQVQLGQIPDVPPAKLAASRHQAVAQQSKIQQAVIQHNIGKRQLLYLHTELSNSTADKMAARDRTPHNSHFMVKRKLLMEKSLEGNCLAHKTAVAAGMLSQYLRFFLDPGSSEYQAVVQVDGINHMMLPIPEDNYDDRDDILDDLDDGMGAQPAEDLANEKKEDGGEDNGNGKGLGKNYLADNEDKPQAYYNDDDDDHLANRGQHLPRDERPNADGIEKALHDQGVKAADDGRGRDGLLAGEKAEDAVRGREELDRVNPKHQPIINQHHEKGEDGANNYPYYYDDKDNKKEAQPNHQALVSDGRPADIIVAQNVDTKSKLDSGVSVGTSYAILLVVMALLLYYVTKFVRRRRVLIKYH